MRDWTCEECTMLMSGLADFMVQEETITEGVAYLQGEISRLRLEYRADCDVCRRLFLWS